MNSQKGNVLPNFDIATAFNVDNMPTYLADVQAYLASVYDTASPAISPWLSELQAGKLLRPALVIASAVSGGKTIDTTVIQVAAAVQLVHVASLIHDDVIDRAEKRHQKPTVAAKYGLDAALLAGDFLFARACYESSLISAEIGQCIALVITELCRGEAEELIQRNDLHRSLSMVEDVVARKTASLTAAACEVGALCAQQDTKNMRKLGAAFGAAFQELDDILDFIADPTQFGKPIGGDIKEGNYTLPIIFGLKSREGKTLARLLKEPKPSLDTINSLLIGSGAFAMSFKSLARHNSALKDSFLQKPFTDYFYWVRDVMVDKRYRSLMVLE